MSNSKLIKVWFEGLRIPVGFKFNTFSKALDGLRRIDELHHRGTFTREALTNMKLSYLRRFE